MSRFLRDRLQIGVEPGKVTLVRLARPGERRVVDSATLPCPNETPMESAVQLLATELLSQRWQGTRVRIVIGDLLARYLVAPVPQGARSIAELREASRLRFQDIYGEDLASWAVMMDLAPWTPDHLGSALPKALVDGVRGACRNASLPIDGIVPFGISEFNRHHRTMAFRSGWFVAVGAASVWMALKSRNGWRHVETRRLSADGITSLPRWLAQGQLRAGLEDPPAKDPHITGLVGDGHINRESLAGAHCPDALLWPGQGVSWSSDYRLALSPVWPRCA